MSTERQNHRKPFWEIETRAEREIIQTVLARRFPELFRHLSRSLEQADPMEIVYPGNTGEYDSVVREMIVMLDPVDGDLGALTSEQIRGLVVDAIKRCFGESPDDVHVDESVRLLEGSETEA